MKILEEKDLNLEREYGCSERISHLREKLVNARPHVSSERAKIVTKAYQELKKEPIAIKRAMVLDRILNNIKVWIMEDELIVGHSTEHHRSAPVFPEMGTFWLKEELDDLEIREQDRYIVPEEVKKDLREIFPKWEGETLYEKMMVRMPDEAKKQLIMEHPVINAQIHLSNGLGHICQDFEKIIKVGFKGVKKETQNIISELDLTEPGATKKLNYLKSILIVCDAIITFAHRYANVASEMAKETRDLIRKEELEMIAKVCRQVPENPATSFWEALQSIWFVQLVTQLETDGVSISPGRIDQYLYPYYKNDIDQGKINKDFAQELLEAFWIKFSEMIKLYDKVDAALMASYPMGQHILAGGVDSKGRDATNELSYMMLRAQLHLRLPQPNFGVRVHSATPGDFLIEVAKTIRDANSMPQIDNDEVYIPALVERGIPLHLARCYALEGCNEPGIPGLMAGRGNGGFFNQTKCLELALNDGKCRLTGFQMGPKTGDPTEFKTMDDVWEAYQKQIAYFVKINAVVQNTIDSVHGEVMPVPFVTATMNCLESAKDVTEGGCIYNFTGPIIVGIGTTGNSLAAINQLIFKEKKLSMKGMINALNNNFKGYEEIKKEALAVPKWGNDEEQTDEITAHALDIWGQELRKYINERGGAFIGSALPVTAVVAQGKDVGATPCGRLAKTPLSDSIGAQPGTDISGPTAMVRSVSKLDHMEMANGLIFNLRIDPDSIKEENICSFVSLLRTFIRLKCMQIQFNIISSKVLRKAQISPEKYNGLTVRVAGYSAFFNDLSKTVQEEIIKRTEHKFS